MLLQMTWWVAAILIFAISVLGNTLSPSSPALNNAIHNITAKRWNIKDLLALPARPRTCPSLSRQRESHLLAYVTPWNDAGYSYTNLHRERLTHVVPVWYQVTLSGGKATLTGKDAIKQDWYQSQQRVGVKVLPRFELRFESKADVEALLFFPRNEETNIVSEIVKEVQRCGYDGAMLEIPMPGQFLQLIKAVGRALHKKRFEVGLVVPVRHSEAQETPLASHDLEVLDEYVDLFSLNTYDHSSSLGIETGNAPMPWLKDVLQELFDSDDDIFDDETTAISDAQVTLRRKVLLGLNFYGHTMTKDSVMNTITAKEYTGFLEFSMVSMPLHVTWHEEFAEHKLESALWNIWYPTTLSILHRLNLAKEYGIGISIWEAGQGLEHFWDVL